jgi:hypothetical protein
MHPMTSDVHLKFHLPDMESIGILILLPTDGPVQNG